MPKFSVEFSPAAIRDLESLYDYVAATRSPIEAKALLDRVERKIDALEEFPKRGSYPSEMTELGMTEFRQLLMTPYRIIYRIADRTVSILVVADGRRDMKTLLGQRLVGE